MVNVDINAAAERLELNKMLKLSLSQPALQPLGVMAIRAIPTRSGIAASNGVGGHW